ncbi:addiction module toxin RelE [Leclercia adecarboxylata]|uniref:Addiction module toxin RelE n=1 Tax=Leclercia adecarboxylata TaxID=83655 RepID=A0A855ENF6_9ENTR|nr:addiction module toxin RelE [Leclercia adecarboxylata]
MSTKSCKLHPGGKAEAPQALTQVSDWGEQTKPMQR